VGDVADRIRTFLRTDVRVHGRDFTTDDTPLLEGLVDSLQVMRLISFVEDEFGVAIDIALVTEENFRTIADIERLVVRLRGAKA
jgi:acyl carrier protein